ncbi:MAG: insulinase family protein [Candidatus Omnitrophica bacterium]|nr:insulinase family protein [Candidatus Omnitrophota bacterium]
MKQEYIITTLNNHLRIVTSNMPAMKSVALGIWIKVGGRYEEAGFKGISHFFEHLAFKGTKKYSCQRIKESIEGVGGSLNGFTSEELTCYLVRLPSDYIKTALDILSDMVIDALLEPQDIEKERTVILEEIKMYKDLPQLYVHELLNELLWPRHPLGMPVVGTMESVTRIQRKDLLRFKNDYYNPKNITVSAVGNLNQDKFIKMVEERFSFFIAGKNSTFKKADQNLNEPRLKLLPKETEQTHLALGFYGLKRNHPLRYALSLLHIILGANMSSRLFNELREKRGLAYEIGTQLKRFYDTGAFVVHAGVDNQKVIQAIELILKELKKIKESLVSDNEFKRAKEFYLGQLMLTLEDTLDNMLWVGEMLTTLDRIYTFEDTVKQLEKITPQQIREVAKLLFKQERLKLALIGPLKDKEEEILKKLSF